MNNRRNNNLMEDASVMSDLCLYLRSGSILLKEKLLVTAMLIFCIVYSLSPIDVLPETIPVVGFLDDIIVLVVTPAIIRVIKRRSQEARSIEVPYNERY